MKRVRDLKKQLAVVEQRITVVATSKTTGLEGYAAQRATLRDIARLLNVAPQEIATRLDSLRTELEKLTEQAGRLSSTGDVSASSLMEQAETVDDTSVIVVETSGATPT